MGLKFAWEEKDKKKSRPATRLSSPSLTFDLNFFYLLLSHFTLLLFSSLLILHSLLSLYGSVSFVDLIIIHYLSHQTDIYPLVSLPN